MAFSTEAASNRTAVASLIALARKALALRPVRFVLVGGLNTLFGYGLFAAFYLASHHRQISLVAATVVGMVFNFFTTGRLVFANRSGRAAIPFAVGYAAILGLNMALLELLARAGLPTLEAQAVALPIMVAVSYVLNRHVIFASACRASS